MTISMTDTALDMEKKTIRHYTKRNHRLHYWGAWIYSSIFLMSYAVFYIFWCTNMFNNYVLSYMELRNDTRTLDWWKNPPIRIKYNIYIFNYTNVNEFESGSASKLRVQEIGPYEYRETWSRVNVQWHDNDTITFQNKKSFKWIGGQSIDDIVVVPNVPLMFYTAYLRDKNYAMRFLTSAILSSLQEQPFIKVTADGFLWGYDSKLFNIVKPLIMLQRDLPFEKFGVMAMKKGIDLDRITIHRNMENLGLIDRVNGMDNRHTWGDDRCDTIEGTEGMMFPYNMVENISKPIYVYSKDMCRKLPFHFTEQVTTNNIPSLRYKFTPDAYNFSNEQNECFCPKVHDIRVCPPTGLFNLSACVYGSPLISSFPHFYGADKSVLEHVDGLHPQQEDYESYIDVHPRLPIAVGGWSKAQLNLEVREAVGMPVLGKLKDGTILPLIWLEIGLDELPEEVEEMLYKAYFTAGNIEIAIQWGSLIIMIVSLSATIVCLWHIARKYCTEQNIVLRKTSSGQNNLLGLEKKNGQEWKLSIH